MSQLNQVATMAENIAAQVAATTENTNTETANTQAANIAAEAVSEEPKTAKAAKTEKAAKGKKGEAKAKKQVNQAREDFEDAQLEVMEREREIVRKQKELQKCLQELARKKQLSDNRAKFVETLDQLNEAEKLLNPEDFETKRMKLQLNEISESGYSRDGLSVSISNSRLILEFIAMLREKVSDKISEIETELIK